VEEQCYVRDERVMTQPQHNSWVVLLDMDVGKPLEVPQLHHLLAGQQSSTNCSEHVPSTMTVEQGPQGLQHRSCYGEEVAANHYV
jgi:hypothetical protein